MIFFQTKILSIFVCWLVVSLLFKNVIIISGGMIKMMSGKVKWFNNDKGYGFLEVEGKDDIFVHYSAIKSKGYRSLLEGQYVNFELINTAKGLQAKNVEEIKTTLV